MKILLLGKDGQVGRELQRTLLPLGEVVALGRAEANFEQPAQLINVVTSVRPDVIVNAAAYTAVDKAESERALAHRINAESVGELAHYAQRHGALLVHYSTDYVFDGNKATAYVESDATMPQSVYGQSKRAGELAIQQSGCDALILRTSWVFSAQGGNFIKTILRLATERENLSIVADQVGAPTSAELIADVTALALLGCRHKALPCGLYHLTAAGATSWHGLASYVVEKALAHGAKLKLDSSQIRAIPTEDYPLPAKRPKNSRLDTTKLSDTLKISLPDWPLHVDRCIAQLFEIGVIV